MARELVISFLYGEFTAAMVDGARVIERWSPSASDRAHGFHEAAFRYFLESAVEHFDCAGEEAVLVVGDVEMEHHQVSLPPVNKQQRQQLLKIESARLAEGRSLTWSHLRIGTSPVSSGAEKGFDLYLLHCWPQIKLNGYLADFAHAGVTPRLIIPDVTLFHTWAMEAGLESGSFALVNTTANGTTVMLMDPATLKLFVRRLSPAIGHSRERLPGEIRRSLQYASQDIGLRPSTLVTNDQQLAIDLQAQLDRRITIEIETSWAEQPVLASYIAGFSRRDAQSFVPDEIRYAKYNRVINRVVKTGIALVAISSVITWALVEWSLRDEQASLQELASRYELREREQRSLLEEIDKLRGEQVFAEGARIDKQMLTYWLIRDLGSVLPPRVRLSAVRFSYEDSTIDVELDAKVVADNVQQLDDQMRAFGETLAAEPWLVRWPDGWREQWRNQYINGRRGQQLDLEITAEIPR